MLGETDLSRGNSVYQLLDRHIAGRGERVCIRYENDVFSYSELHRSVGKAARLLAESNIEYENRMVLILPDSPLFVVFFLAALRLGAVPVPVSTRLSPDEYSYILADCRPKAVLIGREHSDLLERLRNSLYFRPSVWVVDDPGQAGLGALLERVTGECPIRPTSKDDMALIQYTSGSTGIPKGVVHLHRGLLAVNGCFGQRLSLTQNDVCFSAAKLSFGYGLGNSLLFPLSAGASTVLYPRMADPFSAYQVIERFKPTVLFGVPSFYSAMLSVPRSESFDLSCLRLCVSGGEHLSASLFRRWKETFGHEILDGIGATECLHIFISGEPGRINPGSTGTIVAGYEAKIVDDEGAVVRRGEIGHLYIKGECNAARYWNKHEETRSTMVGPWTRTGDLFYQNEDGYFFFAGRSDDVIKVGGMKVLPREVEECLSRHESVRECAVVGVRNADQLTTITAYVSLREGWDPGGDLERELKKFVRQSLSPHKCPGVVEFVPEIPKTSTGKIARYRLRAQARK